MQKNVFVFLSALTLLFSMTTHAAAPAEDDSEDIVETVMMMYLTFAVPEACAQTYPDLRKSVDNFRTKFAKQISAGAATASDAVLPKDIQKEVAGCIRKQSALSKGQCGRFVELLSASVSSQDAEDQQGEEAFTELETLAGQGRQMIAGCADQKEKQLRQKFR